MKYFESSLTYLCVFFSLCTERSPSFLWHYLENKEISGVTWSDRKSPKNDFIFADAEEGISIQAQEHRIEASRYENVFKKMEFVLDSIYSDHELPYPGAVSKKISCPEEFLPVSLPESSGSKLRRKGILLYANDRNVFGACDKTSAKKPALYLLLYCKENSVAYEIKVFFHNEKISRDKIEEIYRGFSCK